VIDKSTILQALLIKYAEMVSVNEALVRELKIQRHAKYAYSALAFVVGILLNEVLS